MVSQGIVVDRVGLFIDSVSHRPIPDAIPVQLRCYKRRGTKLKRQPRRQGAADPRWREPTIILVLVISSLAARLVSGSAIMLALPRLGCREWHAQASPPSPAYPRAGLRTSGVASPGRWSGPGREAGLSGGGGQHLTQNRHEPVLYFRESEL